MLKFIETKEEAVDCLAELQANAHLLNTFNIGLVGSFARGSQKKSSKVDILLKSKSSENPNIGSARVIREIKSYMKTNYTNKYTVLWYDLLSKEEENLHALTRNEGINVNPLSLFVNVAEEIVWVDKDAADSDIDEDIDEDIEDDMTDEGDEE